MNLTAGIPQSTAAPDLSSTWGRNPWKIDQETADLEQGRRQVAALAKIDQSALDPDGYYAGKDLSFRRDPKEAQKLATIDAFLMLQNGGEHLPPDPSGLTQKLFQQEVALRLFDGRGAADNNEFHGEIVKAAQGRKDRRALAGNLATAATRDALLSAVGEGGGGYREWIETAKQSPGYDAGKSADYLEAWAAARAGFQDDIEEFRAPLESVWRSIKDGGQGDDDAFSAYSTMDADQRGRFMDTLAMVARTLPAEQQRGFWSNLVAQAGRDVSRIVGDIGKVPGSPSNVVTWEDFAGSKTTGGLMERRILESDRKQIMARINFRDDIARVRDEVYDPIKNRWGDGILGDVESGIYAIPGALATTAIAAVPGAGQIATFSMLEGAAYSSIRRRLLDAGMDDDQATSLADGLAGPVGALQYLPERLGVGLVTRRLPALERVLNGIGDRITNRVTRGLVTGGIVLGGELSTEITQDFIPAAVQDIAAALREDVPAVDWDAELDGFWSQTTSTAVAILPLAILGGAGGLSREARVRAFAEASPAQRLAYGITAEDSAAIDAAAGQSSLNAAVETAIRNRQPDSESARDATQDLAEQLQASKEAAENAQDNGLLPRAVHTPGEGWTLYDTATGEEIGKAPDWQSATRLAAAHANFQEEQDAERVAYLATMLQAAEKTGSSAAEPTSVDLHRDYTTIDAMRESESRRERVLAQDALDGGDGSIPRAVLGDSVTEMQQGQRRVINRLFGGSNVLTVFHEEAHRLRRKARAAGALTFADDVAVLQAVDTMLAGRKSREGKELRFLPADFDTLTPAQQETIVDERISELLEAEILRTRKGGGKHNLPAGVVSRNLSAIARLVGDKTLGKFRSFIRAFREHFGLAADRAIHMRRGLADGTIDQGGYDAYLNKLLGLSEQADLDQMARDAEAQILDGLVDEEAASLGDPFSLGSSIDNESSGGANIGDAALPANSLHQRIKEVVPPQASGEYALAIVEHQLEEHAFRHGDGMVAVISVFSHRWPQRINNHLHRLFQEVIGAEKLGLDTYIRVTNAKADYEHLKAGTHQGSRNHGLNDFDTETDPNEGGLSVSRDFEFPAKYAYLVKGKRITTGTDGEPVLDLATTRPVGPLTKYETLEKKLGKFETTPRKLSEKFFFSNKTRSIPWLFGGVSPKPDLVANSLPFSQSSPALTGDLSFSLGPEVLTERVSRAASAEPLVASTETWRGITARERRDRAVAVAKEISSGEPIINQDRGKEIGVGVNAMKHWSRFAADPRKAALIDHMRELLGRAIFLRSEKPDSRKAVETNIKGFHRLALPALIDNEDVVAIVVVREDNVGNYAYDGRILDIETPADGNLTSRESEPQGGNSAHLIRQAREQAITDHLEVNAALATDDAFALGAFGVADELRGDALNRIKNPVRRAQAMGRIARSLEEARLQAERLELTAGNKRLAKSLRKEAAMREAMRVEELEREAYARHWAIFSDDDLVKIKSQPVHAYLSDPDSPLRGRLVSKTAAIKKHPDLFQIHRAGDYDGADGVSRSVFGGQLMPDQAAQELFDQGLINSPTPDAMWEALLSEQSFVEGMRETLTKAKEDIRAARLQAKEETNAWLAEQTGNQEANYSPKEEILRTLSLLDGILRAVPAEIRGKVGGYTQLARIGTNENRLEFLQGKLAQVDKELEKWLRVQFGREMEALLKRAKPDKDEAGKAPRGKIGSTIHDLFRSIEDAMGLSLVEAEAEAVRIETLATDENVTPEQASHATLEANLIRLVADWHHADAARRESAVVEATRVFQSGYGSFQIELSRKAERRRVSRDELKAATGKNGHRMERVDRAQKDATRKGRALQTILSLLSFEQVVQTAFGEASPVANMLVDWERRAAYAKHDATTAKEMAVERLFSDLAGGKFKGEQLRWKMSQPGAIEIQTHHGKQTFSELEAISATLMWRQEDGRRHMEGHLDDSGKPVGDWHYTQEDIDAIEDQLSQEAKAVRLHLGEQYAAEYERLNEVYRQLYGVSMPRHKHYSPLTVKPSQSQAGQMLDPVTGAAMSGASLTPGSLRSRMTVGVAEPDFRDALQTYIAHTKQMEHWMAYAPFAAEAMALINSREVGNAVEAAGGREALSILRGWLDLFAQGGTRDAAAHLGLNKALNRAAGRAATVALVGRVSVLVIQSTQLLAGVAQMPTGAFITRFAKLMSGQLGWGPAMKSDFVRRRMEQMPPVVRQAMEGLTTSRPNRLKFAVARMGETISGADALFTAGTYAIVYDYQLAQAKAQGLTGAEAAAFAQDAAERATERIAQPTRTGTRSLYEATATNPAARILWSFASEPRQKLALAAYAMAKKPAGEKARALFVTWVAGGMVASLIRAAMRDLRDDEDDEWFDERNWNPARLALSSLTGPFQGIPVIGDSLEAGIFKLFGEFLPEGNLFSSGERAVDAATNLPDWFTGDREFDDALKDLEAILSGAGLVSETGAAAAAVSHAVRDAFEIINNFAN